MANIVSLAVSGAAVALNAIRQFLSYPSITYIPIDSNTSLPLPPQTVFFQVTKFVEKNANQVSKMLLVDVSVGKSFVTDNIAPLPTVWEMEGFMFPYIPTIPLVDQIGLEYIKQTVRDASKSRQIIQFKPVSTSIFSQFSQIFKTIPTLVNSSGSVSGTIPVAILDVEFHFDPEVINKAPFSMTLQEINTLTAALVLSQNVSAIPNSPTNAASAPASSVVGNATNTPVLPATVGF